MKIACIGDSITWGFTILKRNKYSYPAVLQTLVGPEHEVHNFGCNNATASADGDVAYMKRKVYRDALALHPDVAIVMLGTNDTKPINYDAQKFVYGYMTIINSLQELGAKVYLMTPPHILNQIEIRDGVKIKRIDPTPIALSEETLNEHILPAIRNFDLPVIEINNIITDISQFNDGIHPNKEGAALIAQTVYSRLLADGIISE